MASHGSAHRCFCGPPHSSEWLRTLSNGGKCEGTELASSGYPDLASVLGPLAAWGSPGVLTRAHPTSPLGREDHPRQGGLSGRQASPAKPRQGGDGVYLRRTLRPPGLVTRSPLGVLGSAARGSTGVFTRSHPTSPLGREDSPRQAGRKASPANNVTGGASHLASSPTLPSTRAGHPISARVARTRD
ncbi:hypothetical protein J6590_088893 [Homalodisca vitripennis]|nr:hypothetical protein J6590_088893 [Homalodisca vitripennis]